MFHATTMSSSSPFLIGSETGSRSGPIRWLSPALIGFGGPMAAALFLFPSLLTDGAGLLVGFLAALVLVCTIAFTLTVLFPGDVAAVSVDRQARHIDLHREGPFATSRKSIAFDQIAKVQLNELYDDDGYRSQRAELLLTDGTSIELPALTSTSDIDTLRQLLGLKSSRR